MNQQILEGDWNEIKGQLRQRWGQLTDDDLPQIRGDAEQIIGAIQRKTGEAREAIAHYLQELSGSAASATDTATKASKRPSAARFRGRTAVGHAGCRPSACGLYRSGAVRPPSAGSVVGGVFWRGSNHGGRANAVPAFPMTHSWNRPWWTCQGNRP